ncbi:MAG: hypothetical protein HN423_00005, partial [Alphaproteobacteria bacterium]|nr:hypothetical protein [Alphaproteobacteria bacterium]
PMIPLTKTITRQLPNGAVYEGETRNSKGHGLGVFTFTNGDRYEGELQDGRGHGIGVYYYEAGHATFGLWENGNSVDGQSLYIIERRRARVEAEAPGAEARAEAEALAEVADMEALLATLVHLSGRYIVKPQGTGLRLAPENKGPTEVIPGGTNVAVTGQVGNWYRVVLDDGREGFTQRFLLDPVAETLAAPAAQLAQAPAADEVELAVWNSVKDTTFPAELEAYLAIYPNGIFAPLARIRLAALQAATPEAEAAAQAARDAEAQAARDREAQAARDREAQAARDREAAAAAQAARDREAQAARDREAQAAQQGRQEWPRARLAFSDGKYLIADFEIDTVQNMHLDKYRLSAPTQSAFVSHYRARNGQIWTNRIDSPRVAAEILSFTYDVNFSTSDMERRNNGFGRAYLGFTAIESRYCGFFIEDISNNTERIYGESCISSQASASQKSALARDVREMVDGIRRP